MASRDQKTLREFGRQIEDGSPWPRPVCPVCENGYVAFKEPEIAENSESRKWHHHIEWEPEWIFGTFYSIGHCENSSCQQIVTVTGTYRVGMSEKFDPKWQPPAYSPFYRVEHFSPQLTLILLPEDAPEDVREAVNRSAKLLFLDPGLAATALRASVERYLTSAEISATAANGNFIPLDTRVKNWKLQSGQNRVAALFLAVKWIGNEGTHEVSDLTVNDVLEGAEFIDEAFHTLFVAPDVDSRAQIINANKGRSKGRKPAR